MLFNVEFLEFILGPGTDLLYYGNGTSLKSEEAIGVLTGLSLPDPLVIRDQAIWFIFESDESVNYKGFLLTWRTTSKLKLPFITKIPHSGYEGSIPSVKHIHRLMLETLASIEENFPLLYMLPLSSPNLNSFFVWHWKS